MCIYIYMYVRTYVGRYVCMYYTCVIYVYILYAQFYSCI